MNTVNGSLRFHEEGYNIKSSIYKNWTGPSFRQAVSSHVSTDRIHHVRSAAHCAELSVSRVWCLASWCLVIFGFVMEQTGDQLVEHRLALSLALKTVQWSSTTTLELFFFKKQTQNPRPKPFKGWLFYTSLWDWLFLFYLKLFLSLHYFLQVLLSIWQKGGYIFEMEHCYSESIKHLEPFILFKPFRNEGILLDQTSRAYYPESDECMWNEE